MIILAIASLCVSVYASPMFRSTPSECQILHDAYLQMGGAIDRTPNPQGSKCCGKNGIQCSKACFTCRRHIVSIDWSSHGLHSISPMVQLNSIEQLYFARDCSLLSGNSIGSLIELNMPKLHTLYTFFNRRDVSNSHISGPIPTFSHLQNLEFMYFIFNNKVICPRMYLMPCPLFTSRISSICNFSIYEAMHQIII